MGTRSKLWRAVIGAGVTVSMLLSASVANADEPTETASGDNASAIVQPVEGGGVRAMVTLDNANAPTALPFAVNAEPGSQMTVNADGGVDVTAADGAVTTIRESCW